VADPLEAGLTPSAVLAVIEGLGDPSRPQPQILMFLVLDGEGGVTRTVVAVAGLELRFGAQVAAAAVDSKTVPLVSTLHAVAGDGLNLFQ
jgi:hypothetical protein